MKKILKNQLFIKSLIVLELGESGLGIVKLLKGSNYGTGCT
jgi:hypothetical protein